MAEVANANQNAGAQAPNNTPRQGATASRAPARATQFLNPENPPDLIAKFRKEIGKTISEIRISYEATGVKTSIFILPVLRKEGENGLSGIPPAEFALRLKAHKATAEKSAEQKLDDEFSFVSLYEKRLNKEFPKGNLRPTDFTEAGRKRWILNQPFEDRKVLMMNAKQFRKHRRDEGSDEEEEAAPEGNAD